MEIVAARGLIKDYNNLRAVDNIDFVIQKGECFGFLGAPGIIASSSMFAASYECTYGTYVRMSFQKTFDAILATPVNIDDLVAGELIWAATKSVFYGTIIIIAISLFRLVGSPLIVAVIPVLFLSGLIFAEISIICASIAPGIDSFN